MQQLLEKLIELGKDFKGEFDSFADFIGRIYIVYPLVVFCLVFFFYLARFRFKCENITKEQINDYENSGKYCKGLFVELNDSKEKIRGFCFQNKWKKRIINQYNTLFDDKYGRQLKEVYSYFSVNLRLRRHFISRKKLVDNIRNTEAFLDKVYNRQLEVNPTYYKTNDVYECFGSVYRDRIRQIKCRAEYLNSNYLLIKGTAGNGKSVMLCSVADMLLLNGETTLFFNARDIKSDLFKYICERLIPARIESAFKIYWNIKVFLHWLLRKNIYILIDAINENDIESFLENLSSDITFFTKYKTVKVIVSCRSEYYETKYKRYLVSDSLNKSFVSLSLQDEKYSQNACDRLIKNYATHYNFTGDISEVVKEKITSQLLLTRIFFEVYQNQSSNVYELNKFELYKRYLEEFTDEKTKEVILNITKKMFYENRYENIPLCEIGLGQKDYALLDSSVVVCRTIIYDKGTLLEDAQEVVNFVYDEMRDYHLARLLLNDCKDSSSINLLELKNRINILNTQNAICFEGITNYLFTYFSYVSNTEMLEFLLWNFILKRDLQMDRFSNRRSESICSWGLSLLLETGQINSEVRKKYFDILITENPADEAQRILVYFVEQEKKKSNNSLEILLDAFMRAKSESTLGKILSNLLSNWCGTGITVSDLDSSYKELSKSNPEGAERFLVIIYLIACFFDWKEKNKVESLLREVDLSKAHLWVKNFKEKLGIENG